MHIKQTILVVSGAVLFSCGNGKIQQQQPGDKATLSSAGIVQTGSADTARKNIIQENLFEGEDYLHGFVSDQSCCDYSVQQVNGAVRFEVRKTDPDISRSKRAEVTGKSYSNEERWYGFRIRLEDWIVDDAGEEVIQWHPNNRTGSSNVAIWTSSGMYMLVVSPHGDDNMYFELDSIQPNVAADFVLHIKWSAAADGFVEIWKDGQPITTTKNNRTLPYKGITSSTGCYFKMGIYKFGWSYEPARSQSTTDKRVVYFEEFREGNEKARYEDVKPGK